MVKVSGLISQSHRARKSLMGPVSTVLTVLDLIECSSVCGNHPTDAFNDRTCTSARPLSACSSPQRDVLDTRMTLLHSIIEALFAQPCTSQDRRPIKKLRRRLSK